MRTLAAICADVGVEILPTTATVRAGQTTARSTLQQIFEDRGEGHVIQLLRTFTETENHRARIDTFALHAISDIMVAYPSWADSGLRWFDVFDRVDIAAAQRQAKLNRGVVPQRYGVAAAIFPALQSEFAPSAPVKPNRKALAAAARAAQDAARLAHVERRLELGRKLAALRDATPNNKRFGRAVREQFDLHDSLEVAEMMRISRRYGERPEIFRKVGWRGLVELASSATSEAQRRELEARILAGERVNGAEIIRPSATIGVRTPRSASADAACRAKIPGRMLP
ncbi:hypothetical protein GWE18_14395 [Bradyrhizobium sp. CSA112]|uniref:hypothetical protein n=1 Tax=Bradyrhizobium sp. CSA112 TaxID=2699170 RepID=UPI0023B11956|nr:hypothetical protein [Bradyrhizobium sp. CSA112]MDE5454036.1 hypothetical protein [Bradyrhizobium sp. CSA112]